MIEGTLLQYMREQSRGAAARQRGSAAFMFSTVRRERKEGVYCKLSILTSKLKNSLLGQLSLPEASKSY